MPKRLFPSFFTKSDISGNKTFCTNRLRKNTKKKLNTNKKMILSSNMNLSYCYTYFRTSITFKMCDFDS